MTDSFRKTLGLIKKDLLSQNNTGMRIFPVILQLGSQNNQLNTSSYSDISSTDLI